MAILKYNPKKVTGSFTGTVNGRDFAVQFTGWMDGTKITAEYDEDAVTKHVGDDGDVSVVLNCNRGAQITTTFVQGAAVNKALSDLTPNGRNDYMPVGVLSIKDLNGSTVIKATEAWIKKSAKVEFSKSIMGRAWTFDTGEADIDVGAAEDPQ